MDVTTPGNIGFASSGELEIELYDSTNRGPVRGAQVSIYRASDGEKIASYVSDGAGQIPDIRVETPPLEYSLESQAMGMPYGQYNIVVEAAGYETLELKNAEVLPQELSLQPVPLIPTGSMTGKKEEIVVPGNTLYVPQTPKIPETEVKPVTETGEIVLSRVVIPEYIIVHDGTPSDAKAKNYYVTYPDYIKNVASSEIYATWPTNTIRANVLAIMSFTLNRVYTEWYRNQGYDFTITSSTAFDHKWIPERNIYDSISIIVDELFADYLARPNVRQPILTQYCDGRQVQCPNWMTQWGSKTLGDQGYTPIQILRYYYGDDMYINTASAISGIPSSWPGYDLSIGSTGDKVRQMQEQLLVISDAYPAIPKIDADGIFGPATEAAVRKFQLIFGLPVTGIVDYKTWYKISEIYVGVSRIAELN